MKLHIRWIISISSLLLLVLSVGCSPSNSEQADDETAAEAPAEEVEAAEEQEVPAEINQEMCEEACTKIVDCDPDIDEDFHQPCVDGCMNEGKVEEVTCFIESSCEKILEDACGI